ncbi:LLM class flavin-dependent oxidoreductase [Luteipulveratus mongoliensis]|uniref:Alkanesulfonate monooxygenase n=1 Tax=Luteipulveratus mongoliensis TaxID=571913 RepID=A0A0K1JHB9_9MICO|nr:LLM class flavin-dependent oxidoreductase [Luteipulveratus mongoliensis]AKU15983.1 alkanesulfonate monooxygenase [Luteipulveratus mongoliensis]
MPVEFLGMAANNDGTETAARSAGPLDLAYAAKLARAHEDNGWDRVLFAYSSGSPDPAQVAAYLAGETESLRLVVAHRPNTAAPTLTAKTLATLDHISNGRVEVHVITGGSTADQAAEGDHLPKDDRYGRTREFIQILKRAWTSDEPFDFPGRHYQLENFLADIKPVQQPRPRISFGGSSAAAYDVGAREADVFALWGEPLAGTAEQIETIRRIATEAGRPLPTIQVAFRPILAATDELAWEKAERTLGDIKAAQEAGVSPRGRLRRNDAGSAEPATSTGGGAPLDNTGRRNGSQPENAGSQRLLNAAASGERHDRALWTATSAATGGGGNSTALVGTPETVAAALLDYYDLGVRIFSARGYHLYDDAVDFGRQVIPLVRAEVARREQRAGRAEHATPKAVVA